MIRTLLLLPLVFTLFACKGNDSIPPAELEPMLDFLQTRTEKKVNRYLEGHYPVDTSRKVPISLFMKMDGLFDYVEFDEQVNQEQVDTMIETMEALQPIKEYYKFGWHDDLAKLRISVYPLLKNASPLDVAVTDAKLYARKLARSDHLDQCEPYTVFKNGVEKRTPEQLVCIVDLFMPTMNKVYDIARQDNPGLAGTIIFKFKITGDGDLAYAEVQDTDIADQDYVERILSIFELIRFPAHGAMPNTLDLTYPVNFYPPKE